MPWVYYAVVIVIIVLIIALVKKEGLDVPRGSTVAVISVPPHNSGRASMWVPGSLGEPSYNDRRLVGVFV